MKRGSIITFVAVLALCGAGLAVLMGARPDGDKSAPPGPPPERHEFVVIGGEVETQDRVVAIYPDNFPMPSRVTGVLTKEGDDVKKGQSLLQFDNEMLNLKVQEAEGAIKGARFELAKAEAAVRLHRSEVASNEKNWSAKQAELEQAENELKEAQWAFERTKTINKLQLDAAESKVKAARLNLESAKIKLDGIKSESPTFLVDLANEGIRRAQNLKAQAEYARDLMACKAPADGRIIRSFVSDGTNFGPQTREPAFWFIKSGPLFVRAEVTQEFARRVALGKSATIEDEADPRQKWTGRVTKVGDQFLPKRHGNSSILDLMPTSDDRVLECHVSVDVPAGQAGPKYGQKVRVTIN